MQKRGTASQSIRYERGCRRRLREKDIGPRAVQSKTNQSKCGNGRERENTNRSHVSPFMQGQRGFKEFPRVHDRGRERVSDLRPAITTRCAASNRVEYRSAASRVDITAELIQYRCTVCAAARDGQGGRSRGRQSNLRVGKDREPHGEGPATSRGESMSVVRPTKRGKVPGKDNESESRGRSSS